MTALLPSWRDGAAKRLIVAFLEATTTPGSPDFVPPEDRTAVFDNDGTLWIEQPVMPELAFSLERLRLLAPEHPEWPSREPFRSALAGDMAGLAKAGIPGLLEVAVAAQAGTTPEAFRALVGAWLATARDPRFRRPYGTLYYAPMREVLEAFDRGGYRCFLVSAGAAEFLRAWSGAALKLPPDRVIGSTLVLDYVVRDGRVSLVQRPEVAIFSDGKRKPAAIADAVGQRPLAAFGNSDGDYEMLRYVTTGEGRRLGVLIGHDDAEREYAYGDTGLIGRVDRVLADAAANGWVVASMREDWATVFP